MRLTSATSRPAALVALAAALLLTGCGSDGTDGSDPGRPDTARSTAASTSAPSRPDDESNPAPDRNDEVDEAFDAARSVALQSGLRYIDPALGTPENMAEADAKADAQCADLQRNVARPDQVAARRFSTGNHQVTEADGKRINTLLRNTYCGR
ncbi:hypothetical protein SRB5_25960 [Streptomyces sp. RB5]|uniref:DUF732 domain-containing protein n=1 Tax=Streptomyces smaragdinus TaxID=2585196 RepID=A0A7K0CHI7_9ACTN|nr:hypothetical protein [Streptomyces smaragdinus]MQY12462.1 hypothetical protein [Streptomyces smaragdinus]